MSSSVSALTPNGLDTRYREAENDVLKLGISEHQWMIRERSVSFRFRLLLKHNPSASLCTATRKKPLSEELLFDTNWR